MKLTNAVLPGIFAFSLFGVTSNACGADPAPAIAARTQGAVSYISGGIGADEKDAMRLLANPYNLRMVFATTAGEHLADVNVTVRDNKDKVVLDILSEGPCVLAAVPAGTYKVTAHSGATKMTKTASPTAKRGTALYFHFPVPRESAGMVRGERREEASASGTHGCF